MSGAGRRGRRPAELVRPVTGATTVSVRYTEGAGQVRAADVRVIGPSSAGGTATGVDRAGGLAPARPRPADWLVPGGALRLGLAAAGWLLLVVASRAVRRVLDARIAATWAREWEVVEPEWSSRRP